MIYRVKKSLSELPATLYAVNLYKVGLTKQDIYSIENTLERYNKKYPYVSYLLAISNTDSKHCAQREIKKKHTKGRPKTVVLGSKAPRHIHLSVIGDKEHSAYRYLEDIKKAINKRFKANVCSYSSKLGTERSKNFINYSLRQAFSIRKSGIFNEILESKRALKSDKL